MMTVDEMDDCRHFASCDNKTQEAKSKYYTKNATAIPLSVNIPPWIKKAENK